jgi:hypothetical protein
MIAVKWLLYMQGTNRHTCVHSTMAQIPVASMGWTRQDTVIYSLYSF